MTHLPRVLALPFLLVAAVSLSSCDYGKEETFGTYEASRFSAEIGAQTVDLIEAGGRLDLELSGSGRGGVGGEAFGVFLIPGQLYGRDGFTLRVSYLGTYQVEGDQVEFNVSYELSSALRDGEFVDGGAELSRSEAQDLVERFVSNPEWSLSGDTLRASGGEVSAALLRTSTTAGTL